jgi:proteasome lid subunit RPN8/RPN11
MPERFELSDVSNAPHILASAEVDDLATWSSDRTRVVIRYSRDILNDIRIEAVDKFMSIPRGGVEVGGVLFGSITGDEVTILAYRPLELEYKTGPRFILSPADEERLQDLLDRATEDPELNHLEPVGWYHSHTRSEVCLSAEDLAIHERFFPGPRQIALVVRPAKLLPTRAGFFVREADGSVFSESSYAEFLIETGLASRKTPAVGATEVVPPQPERAQAVIPRPRPVIARRSERRNRLAIPTAAGIALIGIIIALFAFLTSKPETTAPKKAPALRLTGSGDNLLIEWTDADASVAGATRGVIDIFDGAAGRVTIPLDRDSLRKGSLTYGRNSGNVEVRLRLYGSDSISSETIARHVQPVAQTVAATAALPPRMERSDVEPPTPAAIKEPPPVAERARTADTVRKAILPPAGRSPQPAIEITRMITGIENAPQISSSVSGPSLLPRTNARPAPMLPKLPAAANPQKMAPALSGRTMWTGELGRGGILMIDSGRPSIGVLNGTLPRGPIRINAHPAELIDGGIVVYTGSTKQALSEPPNARNGWNLTIYRNDPKRMRDITVIESPSEKNDWRLVLRGGTRNVGLIMLDWQQLAGQ